jgi:CubicO group peptidase (beta-lactamase class C family)
MTSLILQRLTLLSLLSLSPAARVLGADYFPPPDSEGGWRTLTTAAQVREVAGMDLDRLDAAFAFAEESSQNGGILVVRHGYLVYEKYFGKGNREAHPDMASIGKAFTSISCGIMLREKHSQIPDGLEQKVFTKAYLPEAFPLSDPLKAEIKLGNLLTMTAGMHGDGANPGMVHGRDIKLELLPSPTEPPDQDLSAVRVPLWTKPGGGYSYSSQSPHVASMVLRCLTGMEVQDYINLKLAKPMGFGSWGYAIHRNGVTLPHTPGGGGIALRSTDAIRFAYLLLHQGRWGDRDLVPADYVALCGRPSPYNPHSPFSLMFEVNADGHVFGAPRDAFFKSGAGGSGIYVVPSLDMVVYKMSGTDAQFNPDLTGLPQTYKEDVTRENWEPLPHDQFHDGPIGGDDGVRRLLEMVSAAVVQ